MTIIKAMGEDEANTLLKSITANMKSQASKGAGQKKVEVVEEEPKQEVVKEEPEVVEIGDDDVEEFKW